MTAQIGSDQNSGIVSGNFNPDINAKTVKKVRFAKEKEMIDGKATATAKNDINTIILCPTGNGIYSTLIKYDGKRVNMYSKGIRVDKINCDPSGKVTMEFNLGNDLTMSDYQTLATFVARVVSPNNKGI